MNTAHREAGDLHCIACHSQNIRCEWNVISAFFAARALSGKPRVVALLRCLECGTKHFDLAVTEAELGRLYDDYRGPAYFDLRHHFEPWYTKVLNDGIGSEAAMRERRSVFMATLAEAGVKNAFQCVLDHGGDRGQMLQDLAADRKCVYEISGARPEAGIETVDAQQMKSTAWDLILSCHVLEHLPAPSSYLQELRSLGKPGGFFFVEVPHEPSRTSIFNAGAVQRAWLTWLCQQPRLLKIFDFLSTGIRARVGVVPPLLFFPLREHLTFFTVEGIRSLLVRNGLSVIHADRLASGHIGVVAVKE